MPQRDINRVIAGQVAMPSSSPSGALAPSDPLDARPQFLANALVWKSGIRQDAVVVCFCTC